MTDQLADLRQRHGLPDDACILIPVEDVDQIPMRTPENSSAMLVAAVGTQHGTTTLPVALADRTDRTEMIPAVSLFAGCWQPDQNDQQPANHHEGDVLIRLTEPTWQDGSRVDVQMLQLYQNRWQIVGTWYDVGTDWPYIVAPTAHAVMGLHTDLCQATTPVTWVEPRADLL